jgi:uroporphyrinogen-III synthase
MPEGLDGLRIVSFESRRAEDLAQLIRRHGGEPIRAPSLQEVPLSQQTEALDFGETLLGGQCDVLILLTGVGTTMLVDVLATTWPRGDVTKAMEATNLVCRGPKPVAALKKLGLRPTLTVPEPNTWRDLVAALDAELPVSGKRVAVQEYGTRNQDLLDSLRRRGAHVTPIPVYAWALPDDIGPVEKAIEQALAATIDVALFTSAIQVEHLFRIAEQSGLAEKLRGAFRDRILVASIGPTTSEALTRFGIETDLKPAHPKMGHLIATVAQEARKALERKRAAR